MEAQFVQLGYPIVGANQTLPDRIADELIARVFTGELRPGQRLPPDRALAEELGVDRTSLRMALRQLSRMHLIETVRGSGVTVLDWRKHAGLDFLAAVLEIPGLELGGTFLLEALDHWNRTIPHVLAAALARATPAQLGAIDALLEAQLAALDAGSDLDHIAALEVDIHDLVVDVLDDVTLRLMANSTRGIRRKLTRLQLGLVDPRVQIETQRAQLMAALASGASVEAIREAHTTFLATHHARLRAHLATLPPQPRRTSRWPTEAARLSTAGSGP